MNKQENQISGQPFLQNLLSSRDLQEKLMQDCRNAALNFARALMEDEVERLAGSKFSHKSENQCHRGGTDQTRIVVGGEKVSVTRPRVRNNKGEVELSSLTRLQDQDIFDDEIKELMVRGVSSRNYEPVVKSWSDKSSIPKSNVSRAFMRASRKDLEKINTQDLSEFEFIALMIDGVEIAERTLIVVLGITPDCQKIPLGIREGDTESAVVIKDLLTSILDRNFKFHTERILAVTDGAKAIKKALRDIFADRVVVQRCWCVFRRSRPPISISFRPGISEHDAHPRSEATQELCQVLTDWRILVNFRTSGITNEIDPVCISDNAITDSVCNPSAAKVFMPFTDGKLRSDDGGSDSVSFLDKFQEISSGFLGEHRSPKIINDQQICFG